MKGSFFQKTTFGIAVYQSTLSTGKTYRTVPVQVNTGGGGNGCLSATGAGRSAGGGGRTGHRLIADLGRHEANLCQAPQVVVPGVARGQPGVGDQWGGVVVHSRLALARVRHDRSKFSLLKLKEFTRQLATRFDVYFKVCS